MAKKKNNGLNNCAWCFRPTSLPAVFAPSTPLIERMIKQKNAAIVRLPTSDEVVSEIVGLFMSLRKMKELKKFI